MNGYQYNKMVIWLGLISLVYVGWKLAGGFSFGLKGVLAIICATAPIWLFIMFISE